MIKLFLSVIKLSLWELILLKQEVINHLNPAEQTKQTEAFPAQTQTHKLKLYFYLQTQKQFLFVQTSEQLCFDVLTREKKNPAQRAGNSF